MVAAAGCWSRMRLMFGRFGTVDAVQGVSVIGSPEPVRSTVGRSTQYMNVVLPSRLSSMSPAISLTLALVGVLPEMRMTGPTHVLKVPPVMRVIWQFELGTNPVVAALDGMAARMSATSRSSAPPTVATDRARRCDKNSCIILPSSTWILGSTPPAARTKVPVRGCLRLFHGERGSRPYRAGPSHNLPLLSMLAQTGPSPWDGDSFGDHADPGPAPARRERVEPGEPLHRLGRRRPLRQGS